MANETYHGRSFKLLVENRQDLPAIGLGERVQGLIDANPARLMKQEPRKPDALQFIVAELVVPIRLAIELAG